MEAALGGPRASAGARGCLETNKTSSHPSPGGQGNWNLCSGGPYRSASANLLAPSVSQDARAKSSLVGPLPSAQRNEAQKRLAESIGLIARLPRLATSRGIVKFALSVSLPLIRARKSLRVGATPNSSAQRYIKAAFR